MNKRRLWISSRRKELSHKWHNISLSMSVYHSVLCYLSGLFNLSFRYKLNIINLFLSYNKWLTFMHYFNTVILCVVNHSCATNSMLFLLLHVYLLTNERYLLCTKSRLSNVKRFIGASLNRTSTCPLPNRPCVSTTEMTLSSPRSICSHS